MGHFHCPATPLNILTPRVTPRALIPRGVWVQTPLKKRKKQPQPMSLARYAGENFANFHSKFCIANPMRGPLIFHFCRNYPCQRIMVSFFEFSRIQDTGYKVLHCQPHAGSSYFPFLSKLPMPEDYGEFFLDCQRFFQLFKYDSIKAELLQEGIFFPRPFICMKNIFTKVGNRRN